MRAFIENVEQEDIFGKQDIEHHHCRGRRGASGLNNLYNVWIIIKSAAKFLRKLIFPEEPPGGTWPVLGEREGAGLEDIFVSL